MEIFQDFPIIYSFVGDAIFYLMAAGVNFTFYTKIIITLQRRASDKMGTETSQCKVHNQVARLLIMDGAVFFVCFTPWQIANLDRIIKHLFESHLFSNMHVKLLLDIGVCMNFINSTVNPFVYMACSSTYRNVYLKAFGIKRNK